MGGEFSLKGGVNGSAPRRVGRRKFIVAAGGAAALLLTPYGLGTSSAFAQDLPENVMLGEGEVLLDAVTYRDQLWTLIQTPNGSILKKSIGDVPSFPSTFQAESLGKVGGQIIAGGYRLRALDQNFSEGNYAALVASVGFPGLASQPGLDSWPTEGTYEFQTDELVPAYVTLSDGGWSAPIDVPGIDDVAGSVVSVIGGTNSLELVVDSLFDSSMRESATEILNVTVSTQSGRSERSHIANTVHGTSAVLGQDDNKTYVLATSLGGNTIVEVGDDTSRPVELGSDVVPLSVWVENGGKAELFVEGGNGEIASVPLEEVKRRDGDVADHLQDEKLGKRSFGEDVVLAYEVEEISS